MMVTMVMLMMRMVMAVRVMMIKMILADNNKGKIFFQARVSL